MCYKGWLSTNTSGPNVVAYDRQGAAVLRARVWNEEAWKIDLHDVVVTPSQSLAAIGVAYRNDGSTSGFLALVGASGQVSKWIRLSPVWPNQLHAAADGSFWIFGEVPPEDGIHYIQHNILYHYGSDGVLLRSFLSNTDFHTLVHPSETTHLGRPQIISTGETVSFYLPSTGELISVDAKSGATASVQRWPTNPISNMAVRGDPRLKFKSATGIAVTASGPVYASLQQDGGPDLYRLDLASHQWVKVETKLPEGTEFASVIGSDGGELVFNALSGGNFWQIAWGGTD